MMIHLHPITCLQVLKLYHADVINSCIIQESDAEEALTKVCHDQDQPGMSFIFLICIHTNLSCLLHAHATLNINQGPSHEHNLCEVLTVSASSTPSPTPSPSISSTNIEGLYQGIK